MCSSKLKKIIKKVDPLMGGDKVLDSLGLPSVFGDKHGMVQEPVEMGATQVASAPEAPTEVDGGVLAARESERRRRAAAAGQNSTILTGGLGSANTGQKTLLGA
jgi:hypothetical protein